MLLRLDHVSPATTLFAQPAHPPMFARLASLATVSMPPTLQPPVILVILKDV